MALWVRRGRHRWEEVRFLAPYLPPQYLHIAPVRPSGPGWRLSWTVGPEYGADAFPELLDALLAASQALPGEPRLARVEPTGELVPTETIAPFHPAALWGLGVVLCRVLRDPARWLLTLHVARPGPGKIVAAAVERYVGGWWPVLHALRRACSG